MPRGRATGQARTTRAGSQPASTGPASTGPAAVRPALGSAPWRLLRRLPLLTITVVVGVTVLGLQLTGVTVAASWLAAIFALGVAVYLAVGMIRDIRRGHWGVDILAVTAVVSTVAVGEYLAAMIIVLMLAGGEALENYAGRRARRELTSLLAGAPRVAHLLEPDGDRVRDVPVDTVGVGDRVLVRPSELVPVDGVLRSPSATFDESSLTGESIPVDRVAGEPVLSGALNGTGAVTIMATATAADSEYSQIVSLVRSAAASRAPVVRLADRYAVPFTAAAYLLAAAAWILSGDATRFAAVLVVATPCPLLIAAPVAFLGGMSRAARRGIIIKSAAALEQSARIRTVAFDKTGTLTRGRPTLLSVVPAGTTDPDTVLAFAAAAEQYSSHVLATSVTRAATDRGLTLPPVTDAREWATHGVSAIVAGHEVRVGKPGFLADVANDVVPADLQGGELAVYVGIDRRYAGVLLLADPVRDEAAETVRRLAALGVQHTLMVTGDAEATARKVAELVGIADVRAECLPADKVTIVAAATNRPVLMVGDGVNDAPVLAAADVGVAMGARGATAAAESADIVILPDDLSRISDTVASGRRTVQVALQSIWIGIGLSLGLMVVAAFGYLPPVSGAVLQEVVDLATIGNALRAMTAGGRTPEVPWS